jgi:hypothetical protein
VAGRVYHRDARGRFAPTGAATEGSKRKRRRQAAVAGSAVVAGAVGVQQARNPASRARTAVGRRRIVRRHITRAQADHERAVSRRNRVFPTEALRSRPFDAKAARREGRKLTAGYRKQVKRVRKRRKRKG